MKRYRMTLPDAKIETFIEYTKRLIKSKLFPQLSRGALYPSAKASLPCPAYPYLHWDDVDDYVYYGHEKNYSGVEYKDFSFDKETIGEL